MKSLPTVLVREKNKLHTPDPWLVLLDIALSADTTLYFCSNSEDIAFQGHTYTAFPFYLEPAKQSSKGEIPTVSLKVCNITGMVQGYLEDLDGAVGAEITVRAVNAGYLDEDFSELEMTFSVLGSEADAEWINFSLGSPSLLRRRFPSCRHVALHCNWGFKSYECAYSGSETECDRTYARCHTLGNTARFGGHMGLSRKGWRIV